MADLLSSIFEKVLNPVSDPQRNDPRLSTGIQQLGGLARQSQDPGTSFLSNFFLQRMGGQQADIQQQTQDHVRDSFKSFASDVSRIMKQDMPYQQKLEQIMPLFVARQEHLVTNGFLDAKSAQNALMSFIKQLQPKDSELTLGQQQTQTRHEENLAFKKGQAKETERRHQERLTSLEKRKGMGLGESKKKDVRKAFKDASGNILAKIGTLLNSYTPEEIKDAYPGHAAEVDRLSDGVVNQTAAQTFDAGIQQKFAPKVTTDRIYKVGEIITLPDGRKAKVIKGGTRKNVKVETI